MDTKHSKKSAIRQFLDAYQSGEVLAIGSGKPSAPVAGGPNRPLAFTGDGKPGGSGDGKSGGSAPPPPPKKPAPDSTPKASPSSGARPKTQKAPPPKKGQITATNINRVTGMQTFLNRLDKEGLSLNDLNLNPDRVIEILNRDPDAGMKDLNERVEIALERKNAIRRKEKQIGSARKKVDVPHQVGPGEKKWERIEALGKTPSQTSATGKAVIARMTAERKIVSDAGDIAKLKAEGKIVGEPGNEAIVYHEPTKKWYPIARTQMGHTYDAVTWWNKIGYFYGANSDLVREWMLDPDIYELEPQGINQSRGAQIGETYRPPHPDPITKAEGGTLDERGNQKLQEAVIAKARELEELHKELTDYRKRQGNSRSQAEEVKFQEEGKALLKKVGASLADAENLATQLAAEPELAAIRASSGEAILEKARMRFSKGVAIAGTLAHAALTLGTVFLVVMEFKQILEADITVADKVVKALELGSRFAAGQATMSLAAFIAESGAAGAAVGFVITLPSDQGGAAESQAQWEAEKQYLDDEPHRKEMAVAAFLNELFPGMVQVAEGHVTRVKNQELWNEAVKVVDKMRKQQYDKKWGPLFQRARDLGFAHATAGEPSARGQEMEKWPEVVEMKKLPLINATPISELHTSYGKGRIAGLHKRAHELGAYDAKLYGKFFRKDEMKDWNLSAADEIELFEEYKKAFNEANKKRAAVIQRARELGYQDGKLGSKAHIDDMFKWQEVTQLIKDGAIQVVLYQELGENYNDAFNIKTGKKEQYEGLND